MAAVTSGGIARLRCSDGGGGGGGGGGDNNNDDDGTEKKLTHVSGYLVVWYFSLEIQRSFAYRCDNYTELNHVECAVCCCYCCRRRSRHCRLLTGADLLEEI